MDARRRGARRETYFRYVAPTSNEGNAADKPLWTTGGWEGGEEIDPRVRRPVRGTGQIDLFETKRRQNDHEIYGSINPFILDWLQF
jgi:hypothetical protein